MQQNEVNSEKHVTNRNGVQLARKARENGVSREAFVRFLNNPEDVKRFCDEIKNGYNWFNELQIEANKIGARVHLIELKVDYTRSYKEAAMAGGPQTDLDHKALKVADLYQSRENKITDEVIVLFKWINGKGSYPEACDWGKQNGLLKTTPHVPFAIGEQFPKLNMELGASSMYVVETTGCLLYNTASACNLSWNNTKRKANLYYLSSLNYNFVWFAFIKKHI
ncbi:MAG: hypothetical protein JJE53_00385 [Candidatus Pacebacteria bacterium]|nr:hypothetical protein [Candidatus Paceibacterota bacterium]